MTTTTKVNGDPTFNQVKTNLLNLIKQQGKKVTNESLFQSRLKQIEMLDGRSGFNEREMYIVDKLSVEQFTSENDKDFSDAMDEALDEAFEKFA